MLYLIGYDLTPGRDYPQLTDALTNAGATKVLLSAWLLPSEKEAKDVHNQIRQQGNLDPNDRLLVVEVTTNSAWANLLGPRATHLTGLVNLDRLYAHARS